MRGRSGVKEFVCSFFKQWVSAMTGPLSILLGLVALYVDNQLNRTILMVCAIGCALFASYRVWKHEREQLIAVEEQIRPKIMVEFIPDHDAYMEQETIFDNASGGITTQRRGLISLRNNGLKTISDIEVFCLDMTVCKTGSRDYVVSYKGGELRRTLTPGEPLFVGVVRQLIAMRRDPPGLGRYFEIQVPTKRQIEHSEGNEFIVTLLVTGNDTPGQIVKFQFGARDDSFFFKKLEVA